MAAIEAGLINFNFVPLERERNRGIVNAVVRRTYGRRGDSPMPSLIVMVNECNVPALGRTHYLPEVTHLNPAKLLEAEVSDSQIIWLLERIRRIVIRALEYDICLNAYGVTKLRAFHCYSVVVPDQLNHGVSSGG
jgi:hypothetical protein